MILTLTLLATAPLFAQEKPKDLSQISIEDLMNMEVTSASKKEQKLSQVPAAIFVITAEDIRRSGALNIPDLLRTVPGLDVAQINTNTWAITARGFNLQFANKLLVLIDGRAVYTPLFGGTNWDMQDVPLEDIERVEVIRGPGGTVWGANAVNGVINIITKKAADTQGGLVTGGYGTRAQGFGTLQYGGKFQENTVYRIFSKYQNNSQFPDLNGQDARDAWHLLHAGLRADTTLSKKDTFTTQGDILTGAEGAIIVHSILVPPENINVQTVSNLSAGDLLGRWDHTFSERSATTLQFYFDRYKRAGPEAHEARDTFDIDFENHILLGPRHDLIWGAGYRHTTDQTMGTIDQSFTPEDEAGELFNVFAQDQVKLKPDRVALYLGLKFEDSYFTGFDAQPSARLAWTPNHHRTLWAAISRATRTPTRRDLGLEASLAALPGPEEIEVLGNPKFDSEHVIAYEAGFRAQPVERFSFDIATFINDYRGLESSEALPPFFESESGLQVLLHPLTFGNKLHGTTEGVELSAKWKVTNRWTLSPGYSFLEMHLHTESSSLDTISVADAQGSNPGHQAQLRSHLEMTHGLAWDVSSYFVGPLPAQFIPSYTRLDTQLSWKLGEKLGLSVVGQNLLRDHHLEFNDILQSVNTSQVKRSAYAKLTWQF